MAEPRRPVLLYDSNCRFCRWTARLVDRLDRDDELALLPMLDPEAAALLHTLPPEEHYTTWHLVLLDGTVVGRGVGGRALLDAMRLTRPLARVLGLVPDAVLERVYRIVARHRSRLGQLIPDGPAPRDFP